MEAVLAGFFAASGSLSAKIAVSSQIFLGQICSQCESEIVFRGISVGGVILANILMWYFFTLSLKKYSSVQATVLNTASNFTFTALFGFLFGEEINLQWILGVILIMCGSILVSDENKIKQE